MSKVWSITTVLMMVVSMTQAQPPVKETGGFHHPESVIQSGNNLYVSDIGAGMEPAAKDGDGYIGKIDLTTGELLDAHFLPAEGTLNAPKGMAIDGNTLYVADVDRIVAFDVVSRRRMAEVVIAGTGFLNDLVLGQGKLYASATDNGKIYAVDLKTFGYAALPVDSIAGANGLYFDSVAQRLYCVSIGNLSHPDGRVYAIDLPTGKTVTGNCGGFSFGMCKGETNETSGLGHTRPTTEQRLTRRSSVCGSERRLLVKYA